MKRGFIIGLIVGILTMFMGLFFFTLEYTFFLALGTFIGNFLIYSTIEYFENK